MGRLRIKLKNKHKLHIKERTSMLRIFLVEAILSDSKLKTKFEIEKVLNKLEFLDEVDDSYTSSEPFVRGTLFVDDLHPLLGDLVIGELIRWIEVEDGITFDGKNFGEVKTNLFTQFNYDGVVRDSNLKNKLKRLYLFNRFKYIHDKGRVVRYLNL